MKRQQQGKIPSEWVGAPVAPLLCERKKRGVRETFTPSDRVLRPRRGTKQLEVQATDVKMMTESDIGPVMNADSHEKISTRKRNPSAQRSCKTSRKMLLSSQPEIHHRVDDQLPPSLDGGLRDNLMNTDFAHLVHPKRISNSSEVERKMEVKINFPASNDKIWKEVDEVLNDIIPKIFTNKLINKLSTAEISQKFDTWLHSFFLERFGTKETKERGCPKRAKRPNKALTKLRQRKKQCKAARKALLRAGLKGTPEEEMITKEWFSLIRQHNKLRAALHKKQQSKEKVQAEKSFRADPHKFASLLFKKQQHCGKPTFSAEDAQQYFEKTYRDENRDYVYSPPPGLERPQLPEHVFSLRCPTEKELNRSVKRKRNGAAPGMNALSYIPYKRCTAVMKFVAKLGRKIWKSRDIPSDWAMAYIILLSKSEDLSSVSEFRPIAIACCVGKIFFSVLSDRLQWFMLRNCYISREIQKGFLAGMPGCIEHTFALLEALKDAKSSYRQIVITWLDLANAYGSVRHNLIQFALNWYHVPEAIQKLIFDYYEKLCAFITTNDWSTGFFLFDIGLFQGCVLSTILFDCVFQLLLDFLRPLKALGYCFKSTPSVSTHKKAYADDLTLLTRNTINMQSSVNQTSIWLKWSQTMRAKPSKSISVGFKMFEKKIKNEKFTPLLDSVYSPFDPHISIDGQEMKFIVNPSEKDPFKANHFKFLGRWINPMVNEKDIKTKITSLFFNDIEIIQKSNVNGFMKLWLYQFYALSHLSWPFMINDLDKSFSLELQTMANPYLKRWAGIGRSVDNGLLFRSKKNFGLGLTAVSTHYQQMQIVKCELLRNSTDPSIRNLYETREALDAKLTRVWKASKALTVANAEVELDLKFPSQVGQAGLGFGNFDPCPSPSRRRKLVTAKAKSFIEDAQVVHALSLQQQSVWLQWAEKAEPFDYSWKNIIWGGLSPEVLKFILGSSVNWLRTPDMMQLWGYKSTCFCCLCGAEKCTLHHILSECEFSLQDKRFTWRHDSVLSAINEALQDHISSECKLPVSSNVVLINFVKAGASAKSLSSRDRGRPSLLSMANDWKLLVDLPGVNYVFPPEIYGTDERPDVVIWSLKLKKVILIELTCPAEEGIEAAQIRKQARYLSLVECISATTSWKPLLMTVEVGVRGFVAIATRQVFAKLGIPRHLISSLCNKLGSISARCSYAIFLAAQSKTWDRERALLA